MSKSQIQELIRKYNAGECTSEERKLLEEWYQSFEWNDNSSSINEDNMEKLKNEVWFAIRNGSAFATPVVTKQTDLKSGSGFRWWYIATAAAAAFVVFAVTTFFISQPEKKTGTAQIVNKAQPVVNEIKAGTSKAQLVLGNGTVIQLDSSAHLQLKEEDGTSINKQSGKLVYKDGEQAPGKLLFNTLSTPRGGEYQLELPDGSKVWLNAASSLKFPTHFQGKERTVFLQGEAYFEVAKNKAMPFHVKLGDELDVEVAGTHFNIMGYNDEGEIKTTLEEGAVKVTHQNSTALLSPAKEAVIKRGTAKVVVNDADVSRALAWKNGIIEFNGDDLPYIMRQLSRWYDVDVSFAKGIPTGTYKGAIRRQAPLSAVIEILKLAGVQFKIEQKKLTVTGG